MDSTVGVASGLVMSMAMLVHELEKSGSVSKGRFVELLRRSADDAERQAPDHLRNVDRLDLRLLRMMADTIERGPDSSARD